MPSFFKKTSDDKTLDEIKKAVRRKDRNKINFTYIALFNLIEEIDQPSSLDDNFLDDNLVNIRELSERVVKLSDQANEITLSKSKRQSIIDKIDNCNDELVTELTKLSTSILTVRLILSYYCDYLTLTKKALDSLNAVEKVAMRELHINVPNRMHKIQESIDKIHTALNKLQLSKVDGIEQHHTIPTTSL